MSSSLNRSFLFPCHGALEYILLPLDKVGQDSVDLLAHDRKLIVRKHLSSRALQPALGPCPLLDGAMLSKRASNSWHLAVQVCER